MSTATVKCNCGREWPCPQTAVAAHRHTPAGVHLDDDQIEFDWDVWAESLERWHTE